MAQQAVAPSDKIDGAVLKIAGVVVVGAIMSILDITVVSVALPSFVQEFGATFAEVAWTMTAYTLALATVIPITGWAAEGICCAGCTNAGGGNISVVFNSFSSLMMPGCCAATCGFCKISRNIFFSSVTSFFISKNSL